MKRIIAIFLAAALIFALAGCGGNSEALDKSPDKFIESYIEKLQRTDSAESVCEDAFPKDYIRYLKKSGSWKSMIKNYEKSIKDSEIEIRSLKQNEQLTEEQLACAEKMFNNNFNCEVRITDGYEYSFTTILKKSDGKSQAVPSEMCALYLEGEGWKILRANAQTLDEYK